MDKTRKVLASFATVAAILLSGAAAGAEAPLIAVSLTPVKFELAAYPGQKVGGTVQVLNPREEWLPVEMEVEDFQPQGEEGRVAVGPQQDTTHSLKSWVRFAVEKFTIPPRARYPIDFTVEIPLDAEPGSHYGTILARTAEEPPGGSGALVVAKVGALVILDVYGEVREEVSVAEFQAPGFSWKLPVPLLVRFENSGTVHVKPEGTLEIRNLFGGVVATITLPERNVLPGTIRRVDVPIGGGVLAGRYTAKLEATYGRQNQIPITEARTFWFVDWQRAGLPSLILAGVFAFVIAKRKNVRAAFRALRTGEGGEEEMAGESERGTSPTGDTEHKGRVPERGPRLTDGQAPRAGRPRRMDL